MSISKPYEYDNLLQKTIAGRVKFKNEAKSKIPTKTPTKTEKRFKILTPKQMLSRLLQLDYYFIICIIQKKWLKNKTILLRQYKK